MSGSPMTISHSWQFTIYGSYTPKYGHINVSATKCVFKNSNMRHTSWSWLIRCANMKWIRLVLWKLQSGHDSVHRQMDRRTSFSMNKPTTWCKSGRVSLVSSSCLYKTQPERALAQVCHTRIDALSPDEYQFHLLLHRNSHHSQATYPKWLKH